MNSPIPGHEWVPLLSLLLATWDHALRDEVTGFPSISATWRALLVVVIGVLAGALDQFATGGNFGRALLVALVAAGPALTRQILELVRGPKVPAS